MSSGQWPLQRQQVPQQAGQAGSPCHYDRKQMCVCDGFAQVDGMRYLGGQARAQEVDYEENTRARVLLAYTPDLELA